MHWVNRFEVEAPGGEPVWFSGEPEAAGEPPYAIWRARDLSDEVLVVNSDEGCVRLVVEALGGTSVRRRRTVLRLRDDSYLGTDADMECQEPGCSADAIVVVHVRGGGPAGEFETPLCQDHEHVYEDRSWVRDCWERARRRPLGWEFTR